MQKSFPMTPPEGVVYECRRAARTTVDVAAHLLPAAPSGTRSAIVSRIIETSRIGARTVSEHPLRVGQWLDVRLNDVVVAHDTAYMPHRLWKMRHIKARVVREITADRIAGEQTLRFTYGLEYAQGLLHLLRYWLHLHTPLIASALFVLGTVNVYFLKRVNVVFFWYHPLLNIYSLGISFYILSRFFLAFFYKPPADCNLLVPVSVIIACKNEEASIRKTIECVYASDYPAHLLEVIVINDGSTDGTLREMQKAALRHPDLAIIDFAENRGKRHGMAAGARRASGEILIYIDSDSFVEEHTLYKLVQGFADPDIGAVCGHANVSNARQNTLTRMQQVRYFVAFRVMKAAESLFSAVTCCSGCLAAYRRSYVMPILDTWLHQSFLGVAATFGDDRSLTNFMLRSHRVIYDCEAICATLVPSRYGVFFRQQLRWKKSWVRETWIASRFMWKRHPLAAYFFYSGALFPVVAPIIVLNATVLPVFLGYSISYLYIYGAFLMAVLYSLVYLGYHRDRLWIYGVAFCFFYMLVLVWQTYYAMVTPHRNHWGTR